MLPVGSKMPGFKLPDMKGNIIDSTSYTGKPVLVMFICNHCPFVKHVIPVLSEKAKEYQEMGVEVVGINANDAETYPDDSPERMQEFARQWDFSFPYLFDETQETAKAFHAACTPDFFLFDENHWLVYRGQFDRSRPSLDLPVTGEDLNSAVEAVSRGEKPHADQKPSIGCNIKWKSGNEPDYFQGKA